MAPARMLVAGGIGGHPCRAVAKKIILWSRRSACHTAPLLVDELISGSQMTVSPLVDVGTFAGIFIGYNLDTSSLGSIKHDADNLCGSHDLEVLVVGQRMDVSVSCILSGSSLKQNLVWIAFALMRPTTGSIHFAQRLPDLSNA